MREVVRRCTTALRNPLDYRRFAETVLRLRATVAMLRPRTMVQGVWTPGVTSLLAQLMATEGYSQVVPMSIVACTKPKTGVTMMVVLNKNYHAVTNSLVGPLGELVALDGIDELFSVVSLRGTDAGATTRGRWANKP